MRIKNNQKGFTLVELSIVLVIIGLIVSSVLVGADLVRGAELRSTVTQYEGYNSAIATFRGKYGGIPGDVRGATDFGFVGDGNKDGILAATGTTGHAAGENVYFWNHLGSTSAGLISGSYDGTQVTASAADAALALPASKVGERWGVFGVSAENLNYFILGATTPGTASYQTTAALLNSLDARNIDEKVDDAMPYRGIVQARGAHASDADQAPTFDDGSNAAACTGGATALSVTSTYNTAYTEVDCTLRFRFQL